MNFDRPLNLDLEVSSAIDALSRSDVRFIDEVSSAIQQHTPYEKIVSQGLSDTMKGMFWGVLLELHDFFCTQSDNYAEERKVYRVAFLVVSEKIGAVVELKYPSFGLTKHYVTLGVNIVHELGVELFCDYMSRELVEVD